MNHFLVHVMQFCGSFLGRKLLAVELRVLRIVFGACDAVFWAESFWW